MAKKPEGYQEFSAPQYGFRTWRSLHFIQRIWEQAMQFIALNKNKLTGLALVIAAISFAALSTEDTFS